MFVYDVERAGLRRRRSRRFDPASDVLSTVPYGDMRTALPYAYAVAP
jgi:hypothetical protein